VSGSEDSDYLDEPLGRFLEMLAACDPAPSAGAAAAIAVAMAAALAGMVARISRSKLVEADALVERADAIRDRVAPLGGADARAYARVLAARREGGDRQREALSGAADVPLAIAEMGAEIVALAVRLAREGEVELRGEALTSLWLAEAGVRSAARLVEINLEGNDDARLERARAASTRAAEAAHDPVVGARRGSSSA
jgi:formiminotetrahydrofolate cyclodeaminase